MSNSKISGLTSAATVVGTEVLPIVQSSATVKVTVANLTPGLGTITAAKGGTGQTSYAVGDIVYADTTTTLAKLADVATGNALISGGVSTAPSWGKVGLTTHVSGTLPTANGGTNLTSFTSGGAIYASSTSALASSANLIFGSAILTYTNNSNSTFSVEAVDSINDRNAGLKLLSSGNGGSVSTITYGDTDTTPATPSPLQIYSYHSGVTTLRAILSTGGNLTLSTGNIIQGTAAKGFDFSANTPLAGKTSTILNWYEEGTFTPNQGAGLTLVGAFSSTGKYTRIGRQVSISGTVTGATSVAVTAGGVITTSLPFTIGTAGHGDATNTANTASAAIICNTGTTLTSAGAIAATGTITFSATYFV